MDPTIWCIHEGKTPLVAAAIHAGHEIRHEVAENLALSESDRMREEDSFTGSLTTVAQNRLIVFRSRFEIDVNRTREKAVYLRPEDAGDCAYGSNSRQKRVDRTVAGGI